MNKEELEELSEEKEQENVGKEKKKKREENHRKTAFRKLFYCPFDVPLLCHRLSTM